MQKWYYRIGLVVLVALAVYLYFNWSTVQPLIGFKTGVTRSTSAGIFHSGGKLDWQTVAKDDVGYRVEAPGKLSDTSVSAYNIDGSTEPVHMAVARVADNVSYAVAWADNPPIARITHSSPDNLLDMARDGAMDRTHSRLITENHLTVQGYPARDFQASTQSGAGFLYARLISAGQRLYMLLVIYPSADSLREQDTVRFFNSFKIGQSAGSASSAGDTPSAPIEKENQVPETVPAAQAPIGQGQ